MKNEIGRRRWMQAIAAMGAAGASGYISELLAAGDLPPGLHRVDGKVSINGREAKSGAQVNMGDKVATGPGSTAVVVLKGDAMLMRADTIVEIKGSSGLMQDLLISAGRVLTVFSKKPVSVRAANATIGNRGTGAYIEVLPGEVYFCLCYGEAVLAGPNMQDKTVTTKHHEQPLLLKESGGALRAEPGGFRNHTDEELTMLEKLCGREPPFMKDGQYPLNKY
ncbi:MAG TPA: hypothetical protein VFV90_05690 [Usitatibacter sp.]|nr:hypothetical protein [Usitatibacter sp.]